MITVKFNERTKKGRQLFEIILNLEMQGYLTVVRIPNTQTIKAINEAREGKVTSCKNIEDLMRLLNSDTKKSKSTPSKTTEKKIIESLPGERFRQSIKEMKEGRTKPIGDLFE